MKITYIHHSAFCVEIGEKVLVFDYYEGDRIPSCVYHGQLPEFLVQQEIFVFSSHGHSDHFDVQVLNWSKKYPNIHYIFAKEIKHKLGNSLLRRMGLEETIKEKIQYVKPQETLTVNGLEIETLQSTDSGVAFLVTCEGKTIYHAGDLNWWHWEGEPKEANQYQKETFQSQIDSLAGRKLTAAFVVLDPRQEKDMYLGFDYFMQRVKAQYVFPMHMWKEYDFVDKYLELPGSEGYKGRIYKAQQENQEFILE